jgi:hypothetical protein
MCERAGGLLTAPRLFLLLLLFTQLPGRRILRTSLAGSCIERLPRAARMSPEGTLAALEGSMLWRIKILGRE